MKTQEYINYNRVAEAIDYIQKNFRKQPSLDEIAEKVNLSPFHFQRLFTNWAGISPKKFLQYISVQYAKEILQISQETLFNTAHDTGLSGTGRLHDLFVKIEGMTPGEYKNKGVNLNINYVITQCQFGNVLIAATNIGICYMGFSNNVKTGLFELKQRFTNATFFNKTDPMLENALQIFKKDWTQINPIKLHLKGTDFQLKVWEALLKIPMGKLLTYSNIANCIDNPNAVRAVGTAIGNNPIAFLIPCHRVIKSTGMFGEYLWGETRKQAIIGWEAGQSG